ncbi:MAG: MucR family transcriptional regulator [Thermodesulfobacteriota bacterium]
MSKTLVEMAAEIIQSQAATRNMTNEEIGTALSSTFKVLTSLQTEETRLNAICEGGEGEGSALDIAPEKSIQKNKIICMECGQEFKMLSPKHLKSHGLDGRSYRKKYGFSLRQPLCAKSLSDRRKKAGKDRGLPDNLRKAIESRKNKKKK